MRPVVILTEDSSTLALGRWLLAQGVAGTLREYAPREIQAETARIKSSRRRSRLLVLSRSGASAGDIDATPAVDAATTWVDALPEFRRRLDGASTIERMRLAEAVGFQALESLVHHLSPSRPRTLRRARAGRPRASDPFQGVGFDVAVALLLEPDRGWTERDLAAEVGHAPATVHRVLAELGRRGYLLRSRGATRPMDALLLRDDLVAAWRGRIGVPREALHFLWNAKGSMEDAFFRATRKAGSARLLAGMHAVRGPERLVGEPLTVYCDVDPSTTLGAAGFEPAAGRGDLMVWLAPETGVFRRPRMVGEHLATNRVVTYLDLLLADTDRHRAAARAVWEEELS